MDNALDALKIAFAVLIFVIALSITMNAFSQAKTVSDYVFYMADKTNFYDYISEEGRNADYRIVSGETIIPTLYRYYKENFNVIIKFKDGNEVTFNLDEETKAFMKKPDDAPWVGDANNDTKLRVDIEISGKTGQKINGYPWNPKITGGILSSVKGKKFKETFKEIRYSGKEITIVKDNVTGEEKIDYVAEEDTNSKKYTQYNDRSEETLELVKGNTKIEITYEEI